MTALLVDDKKINAEEGDNLLRVCLDNGIYIPNLCYIEAMDHPPASCRLCFVEIAGKGAPMPACTIRVSGEMIVHTKSPRVRRLQRAALQLLLSVHHVDCKNCPANRKCALQEMAGFLKVGLKSKRLDLFLKDVQIDQSHPFLDYYPNRCILCGKCIYVCRNRHKRAYLTFAGRGFDTVISLFKNTESMSPSCDTCRACAQVCPVAALLLKTEKNPTT